MSQMHTIWRHVDLGDEWKLVSANWSGWDIESRDGIRVEVKQSAARQALGWSTVSRRAYD